MRVHLTLSAFRMGPGGYSIGRAHPAIVIVRGANVLQIGPFYAFAYSIHV